MTDLYRMDLLQRPEIPFPDDINLNLPTIPAPDFEDDSLRPEVPLSDHINRSLPRYPTPEPDYDDDLLQKPKAPYLSLPRYPTPEPDYDDDLLQKPKAPYLSLPRYSTPEPDYNDKSVNIKHDVTTADFQTVPILNYETAEINGISDEIPEGYRTTNSSSSDEGNSDVTLVIGDDLSLHTTFQDNCILGLEESKHCYINPEFNGIEDRRDLVNSPSNFNAEYPQVIHHTSRLAEIVSYSNRSANHPIRIFVLTDPVDPPRRRRCAYCNIPQICSWFMTLLFLVVFLVLLVQFHPDSPAVWVVLAAFLILIFVGLVNSIPKNCRSFFSRVC